MTAPFCFCRNHMTAPFWLLQDCALNTVGVLDLSRSSMTTAHLILLVCCGRLTHDWLLPGWCPRMPDSNQGPNLPAGCMPAFCTASYFKYCRRLLCLDCLTAQFAPASQCSLQDAPIFHLALKFDWWFYAPTGAPPTTDDVPRWITRIKITQHNRSTLKSNCDDEQTHVRRFSGRPPGNLQSSISKPSTKTYVFI